MKKEMFVFLSVVMSVVLMACSSPMEANVPVPTVTPEGNVPVVVNGERIFVPCTQWGMPTGDHGEDENLPEALGWSQIASANCYNTNVLHQILGNQVVVHIHDSGLSWVGPEQWLVTTNSGFRGWMNLLDMREDLELDTVLVWNSTAGVYQISGRNIPAIDEGVQHGTK